MEPELKSRDEVMEFFRNRHGFMTVSRICDLLISHNNVQAEEIGNIKGILHHLKTEGFLIVEQEGQDIYHEQFASTPDRVERYFVPQDSVDSQDDYWEFKPSYFGFTFDLKKFIRKIGKKDEKVPKEKSLEQTNSESTAKTIIIGLFVTIVGGIVVVWVTEGKILGFLREQTPPTDASAFATTTLNLLDIYEAAFDYDILADRQEFFRKHIGSRIYGEGTVSEISSLGERYILEIDMGKYSILCPQEKNEDFERSYPLLKSKKVRFYGNFTYSNIFGYDSNTLEIGDCSFERI